MKPIKLKFSGLQSYREEQEIDFETVGELGIFGIFGPTGAGKSTILDAITLALYGNVERAPNGIRGIMNHFEEELLVSFEFGLGNHRYLAERSYKLNKSNMGISNRLSRLIQISENEEVLADKSTHMNEKIRALLGMEFKDFTRAVIIPQNKFDQFLKLTEGERTEMLEKIFGLEEYGEGLSIKVKNLEKTLEKEYDANEKVMLELGDASEEALKQAKIDLEEKQKEVAEKNGEQLKLETKIKDMEVAAKIHQEIIEFKKEKERLDSQSPQIEKEKEKLQYAKKAEVFKNSLKQIEDLQKEIQKEKAELQKVKEEEEEINKVLHMANNKLEGVKKNEDTLKVLKEEELPKITLALNYENQWDKLSLETKDLAKILKKESERSEIMERDLQKKVKDFKQQQQRLLELKSNKKKMTNILHCRKELGEAILLLQTMEGEEKQVVTVSQQLKHKVVSLQHEEERFKKLFLKRLSRDIYDEGIIDLQQYMRLVDEMVKKGERKQETAEIQLTKVIDNNMARTLASKLKEDEACQVCGSTHHPKPATMANDMEEDIVEEAREKLTMAKKELEDLRNWQQELNIQCITYQNIKKEILSYYQPMVTKKTEDFKNIEEKFEEALKNLQKKVDEITKDFKVSDKKDLKILQEGLEKAEEEYQKVNKEIDDKEEKIQELQQIIINIKEEAGSLKSNIRVNQDLLEKNQLTLDELQEKKRTLIGEMSSKDFEKQVKEKIIHMEEEIKQAQGFWEESNKKKQEIQQKTTILDSGLERSKKHFDNIEKNLEEHLKNNGFINLQQAQDAMMEVHQQKEIEEKIHLYEKTLNHVLKSLETLEEKAKEKLFDEEEFNNSRILYNEMLKAYNEAIKEEGALQNKFNVLKEKQKRWKELQKENQEIAERKAMVSTLFNLLRGRKFVKFLAEEHMRDMAIEASIKLGELTGQRYGLELDEKGNFMMRDDFSNGEGRLVTSLSGGETFLTSLALALALSSKIQLKGKPLGFFFLDEGFGTLDNEKLELVMNTLEKLQRDERMVGVISHVEELKSRMPRYIEVTPPQQNGIGSKVMVKYN